MEERPEADATDHNYNDNTELTEAIAEGKAAFYAQIEQPIRQAYRDAGYKDNVAAMSKSDIIDAILTKVPISK